MPYQSDAQRRWAHTPSGEKALGGPSAVKEWDSASKGMKLPERKMTHYAKGGQVEKANYASGGAVLPRSGDFKKTVPNRGFLDSPDRFTGHKNRTADSATSEDWSKTGGPRGDLKPKDKSEAPVKPRS